MDSASVIRGPEAVAAHRALAKSLERGNLSTWTPCPFPLPSQADRAFLFEQRLHGTSPHHIGYDPRQGRTYGSASHKNANAPRLRDVLAGSASHALHWLARVLPAYAAAGELDYVAFHPDEEATRSLPMRACNDLLHIDAAPARSTQGRLLRLYANLHPTDPRVWHTSLPLAELLQRYGAEVGMTSAAAGSWWKPVRQGLLRLVHAGPPPLAPHEDFFIRLREYLKCHDNFQERAPKKCWHFAPETAWLVFTDGLSHAELRGRFVLEFAFSIPQSALALPDMSPQAQYQRACASFSPTNDLLKRSA